MIAWASFSTDAWRVSDQCAGEEGYGTSSLCCSYGRFWCVSLNFERYGLIDCIYHRLLNITFELLKCHFSFIWGRKSVCDTSLSFLKKKTLDRVWGDALWLVPTRSCPIVTYLKCFKQPSTLKSSHLVSILFQHILGTNQDKCIGQRNDIKNLMLYDWWE